MLPPMQSFANETTTKSDDGTQGTIAEAEVLEVKDNVVGSSNFENVDLERAKEERYA